MKNFFVTCAAMAAVATMSLNANAEINFPQQSSPFSKYVKITTDGINVREKPSTSAKKLVFDCIPDTDQCDYVFKAKGEGVHPELGKSYPFVSQEGEWVQFLFSGVEFDNIPGWTMQKFLQMMDAPGAMTAQDKDRLEVTDIPSMPGYALWVNHGPYDENELWIGRQNGDEYVFLYSVAMPTYDESQTQPLEKKGSDDEEYFTFNKSLLCSKTFQDSGWTDEYYFNVPALTKAQIEMLFNKACKSEPIYGFVVNKYGLFPLPVSK